MFEFMAVNCGGPVDKPHPPDPVRVCGGGGWYQRFTPGEWTLLPRGIYMSNSDIKPDDRPTHGSQIRLTCRTCSLDERRNLDREYGDSFPPFSEVFEKLCAAGQDAISAQALVRLVWPS
jgi:hypothetical protein